MSKSKDHDGAIFAKLWRRFAKCLFQKIKILYADKAYWSGNIQGLIVQNNITPVIPPRFNSVDHGTTCPMYRIVRTHRHYPGLYKINHCPERRSSVEHTFGKMKQQKSRIMNHKAVNRAKPLLTPFLWYNH